MTTNEIIKSNIPEEVQKRGRSLAKDVGVLEIAWRRSDVEEILQEIKGKSIVVLGGDVYYEDQNKIVTTMENWYYDFGNKKRMVILADIEESIKKTLGYIQKYPVPDFGTTWFVLVLELVDEGTRLGSEPVIT